MSEKWIAGWGNWLTGPTTVASMPFCGGKDWPFIPVSCAMETIALVVPKQVNESAKSMEDRARLIAAAPDLLEALQSILEMSTFDTQEKARAAIKKATE